MKKVALLLGVAAAGAQSSSNSSLCSRTDLHITHFWACLGPWAISSGATEILLTADAMPDDMGMPKDASHMHDADFCYDLIKNSEYCSCTAPLEAAAACGSTVAANTLSAYQPWCKLRAPPQCREMAPELLRTSMLCTAEGLTLANESDVMCEYDHETHLSELDKLRQKRHVMGWDSVRGGDRTTTTVNDY